MRDAQAESASSRRVLLVEDEAIVALDVRRRVEHLGYEVVAVAVSGEQALSTNDELKPDLVLMDIQLAGDMDGVEAATRIRERSATPIIFLTAHSDPATLKRAGAAGPYGYVTKPFEDRELHTALEIALYKSRMERKLAENERWLAITLKCIDEGLLTTDPEGRIRFANPMAEKLLGLPSSQLLGQQLEAVYHANVSGAGGQSLRTQAVLHCPQGHAMPVEQTVSPILDERGRRLGTVIVFRDVSGRQRVEQALRDSVENLRRTLEETVNALTVTSEKRDPFTAGHQQRVSQLACAVARVLGLSDDEREGLRVAGLVHDIGKIQVPSEILAKPEVLSDMEMGIVRDHSLVGYEILKDIPFPWPVARMVLEHHERMDGSGYPGGLRGSEILIQSRILGVADVVEAMTSHRPYRAALGLDLALEEIRKRQGTRYDSDVVAACLAVFAEGAFHF